MSESVVRLGFERADKALICTVGALVGAVVGICLPYVARWASDLAWVPFQGPLQMVGSLETSWAVWGRPVLGILAGFAFAAYVIYQSPVLYISGEQIKVTERGNTRRISRSDIAGIYREGGKIVVESHHGRRLFHGDGRGACTRRAHGVVRAW